DGTVWIKCGSSVCMTLVNKCHCWRRGQCSNKWHRIHWNDKYPNMLWPENDTNHWKKIPSKQYNT
ncbi:MAG: hypothetical protein LBC71_06910, partial [Oscillospiraceae bacterium]|nr:hypothetical protein [Oscillospiraceae bacterium]